MAKINSLILAFILCVLCHLPSFAQADWAMPYDAPVLHMLIDIHTKMKESEKKEVEDLVLIEGEHLTTTGFAQKAGEAKRLLNEKLAQVTSYITLASEALSIANMSVDIYNSYKDFTVYTYNNALKNPFCVPIWIKTNDELKPEIQRVLQQVIMYTLYQTNVLKATMEEKLKIITNIKLHLARVARVIQSADIFFASMSALGIKEYHVQEILGYISEKSSIQNVIGQWNQNTKQ